MRGGPCVDHSVGDDLVSMNVLLSINESRLHSI